MDLKPTPARIRAMRRANDSGFGPRGAAEHRMVRIMFGARLMEIAPWTSINVWTATDAGRAWLAQHDKEANRG